MDKRGPSIFLSLTLVGLVLGALGVISIPLGHGISGFWVAGVVQVAGGIWFGGWGVVAAAVFPSVSNAITHSPLVSILGFIPANLVQALIPAWAYRHFRQDPGARGRQGLLFYLAWGTLASALAGALLGAAAIVLLNHLPWAAFPALAAKWALSNMVVSILVGIPVQRELTPLWNELGLLVKDWWAFDRRTDAAGPRRFRDLPLQVKLAAAMCAGGLGPLLVLSLLEFAQHGGHTDPANLTPLFLIISLVTMLLGVGFLSRETVRPLRDLETQAEHLLNHRSGLIAVDRRDEIGRLGRAFSVLLEAVRKERELAEGYLQVAEVILVAIDTQSRITMLNRKGCLVLGYEEGELLGQDWCKVCLPPEDSEAGYTVTRRLLAGDLAPVEYGENHVLRKDGSRRLIAWHNALLREDEGRITGILSSGQDITEQREAEAQRLQLESQLQQSQKMKSLGTLAGGVAHDMNNVLAAILGLASAKLETQPEGSPTHRAFDSIAKAALRGGDMVKSLLGFARQSPAEERELDLNTLLREEVQLLERITLSLICLELDLQPDLRPIHGDLSALSAALMNLCVNSVQAMPEKGTLTLRTRNVAPDWVEVLVQDTGTGMSPEVLDRALDPFFTTKEIGQGTGLGLSMVYSTIKAHRGHLEIQSQPGSGTTIRMRFPACDSTIQTAPRAELRRAEGPALSLDVLLVDDDVLVQDSTGDILQALGHTVVTEASGEAALATLEAGFRPDVVILDMNMPGLGGSGTLPRLRALLPEVPVLLSTGRMDQAALDLADRYPHVIPLPKPFSLKDLKRRLQAVEPPPREG